MKNILELITVFLLASLTSPSAALAANWIQLGQSQNGNRFFVDASSVQRQGPFVRYWVLAEFFTPDQYGNTSDLVYATTDCRNGNYKFRHIIYYSGSRTTSDRTYGESESVRQVIPGSINELIFETVCSR